MLGRRVFKPVGCVTIFRFQRVGDEIQDDRHVIMKLLCPIVSQSAVGSAPRLAFSQAAVLLAMTARTAAARSGKERCVSKSMAGVVMLESFIDGKLLPA